MAPKRRSRTSSEKIMIVVGILVSLSMVIALFLPYLQ